MILAKQGGKSGSKSAELDKIYWLLTDTQKSVVLRAKFADDFYETSESRSFRDLYLTLHFIGFLWQLGD